MFSMAYRIDAKCDYQFSMALVRFFTGSGVSNDILNILKSPALGNKSIKKQDVTTCKNTKMKFHCYIFHSIAEVDGRRYFILS